MEIVQDSQSLGGVLSVGVNQVNAHRCAYPLALHLLLRHFGVVAAVIDLIRM